VGLVEGKADGRMNRRMFLSTFGASLLAAAIAAEAQQAGKVARIGYLSPGTATANAGLRKAFTDGLRNHGWIEENNIAIEYRWQGEGKATLDALATELAGMPLDAIFAVNTPASLATKRTGTTLPVVFAVVSEPVEIGLVNSLPKPGQNFTGLTTIKASPASASATRSTARASGTRSPKLEIF